MAPRKTASDAGQAEAQKKIEPEQEKGLLGNEVDQTPNHHYTVEGVTSGKPTPETEREGA